MDIDLAYPGITGVESVIWQQAAPAHQLLGAIIEFDLDLSTNCILRIRTAVTDTAGLAGAWGDSVALLDSHVRGWWPHSWAHLDCGSYDVKPSMGGGLIAQRGVCEDTGPEHTSKEAFEWQDQGKIVGLDTFVDPHGKRNLGCYGADLYCNFLLTNSGAQDYPAFYDLIKRNTSSPAELNPFYVGASFVGTPGTWPKRGVPELHWSNPNADPPDGVLSNDWVTSDDTGAELPIMVPTGSNVPVQIALANGGTASLPVSLLLSGVSFQSVFGEV